MAPSSARSAAGASPQAQQPAAPTPSPVQFPGRANLPADQGVQIAIQQSEQPYAVVPQRRELPRIGQLGLVNGDPVYTAKAAEAWIERYNREGNPNWRAEGLLPDGKGGYKIEYVNVAQERNKAKTELNKLSAQERTEIRKLTLQEGRGISLHPDFKNFLAPNGARPQTRAFVTAFNSATEYPKQAGVADLDMINSYIRATSGGKVTENEVHSLKDAASWADKFLQKADKPLAGSILSKGQREQMLRTMLEMHNGAAEASNFVLNTARERMIKGGEKNEINLPQPYESELILKSDALDLLTKKKAEYLRLQESFKAAKRAGNEGEAQAINNGMVQLALESEHIQNRYNKEKYSSSNILGYKDWVHKYQGYVAGVGSALDMLDRSAE